MKKTKNKYAIIDTFTGDMVEFVATETKAKKICSIYDTLDYREMKLLDQGTLTVVKENKRD